MVFKCYFVVVDFWDLCFEGSGFYRFLDYREVRFQLIIIARIFSTHVILTRFT